MNTEDERSSENQARAQVKYFFGFLLLFLTPVFLFVKPVTKAAVLRDFLLVIWWVFIFWLLITGRRELQSTNSKQPASVANSNDPSRQN